MAQTGAGGPKGLDGGSGARQVLTDAGFPRAAGAPSSLPTSKAGDGERGRDKARVKPDLKGRELATVLRDSLPSPRTCSAMASQVNSTGNLKEERFLNLETVIGRMLPTPTAALGASGGSNCNGIRRPENTASAVNTAINAPEVYSGQARKRAQLLTATANDWKGQTNWEARERHGPQRLPDCLPTGEATYLNPCFVEEMMGYPVNWTKLED